MPDSVQMATQITALLVHSQADHLRALERALRRQSVEIRRAANCRVAARLLNAPDPPHLVFVDATLPDGTWRDIIAAAQRARQAVNVIVVPPHGDMRLYIDALEGGAFDFIAPPIADADFAYIVHGASANVLLRRSRSLQASPPPQ